MLCRFFNMVWFLTSFMRIVALAFIPKLDSIKGICIIKLKNSKPKDLLFHPCKRSILCSNKKRA